MAAPLMTVDLSVALVQGFPDFDAMVAGVAAAISRVIPIGSLLREVEQEAPGAIRQAVIRENLVTIDDFFIRMGTAEIVQAMVDFGLSEESIIAAAKGVKK